MNCNPLSELYFTRYADRIQWRISMIQERIERANAMRPHQNGSDHIMFLDDGQVAELEKELEVLREVKNEAIRTYL